MAKAPTAPPKPVQYAFTVYQDGTEYTVQAEDFEVASGGVHFVVNAGTDHAQVIAYASHPCIVIQVRLAAAVAK